MSLVRLFRNMTLGISTSGSIFLHTAYSDYR